MGQRDDRDGAIELPLAAAGAALPPWPPEDTATGAMPARAADAAAEGKRGVPPKLPDDPRGDDRPDPADGAGHRLAPLGARTRAAISAVAVAISVSRRRIC